MTRFRQYALFQLGVLGLTAVVVVTVYIVSGNAMASLAGFSLLALLGLQAIFVRGKAGGPVQDERDELIQQRAVALGYMVLWLAMVAWGVAVPLVFADHGTVPLVWVAPVVWVAWWLVALVRSVAILLLDSRGV